MIRVTRYDLLGPDAGSMRTKRSLPRCSRTTASSLNRQVVPSKGARTSAPRASRVMRCIGEGAPRRPPRPEWQGTCTRRSRRNRGAWDVAAQGEGGACRGGRVGRPAGGGRPGDAWLRRRRCAGARPEKRSGGQNRCKMAFDGGHGDAKRVYLSGGKGPPKPPPKSAIGLTEVERAISVLDGRHPEHEKIRRQNLREAAEQRRGQLEVELGRNARARMLRTLALAAVGVALAIGGWFAWKMAVRTRSLQAALAVTEAPWLGRGFPRVDSNELTAKRTLEADFSRRELLRRRDHRRRDPPGQHGERVARRAGARWRGASCPAGHATIDAPAPGDGLTLLRIDGSGAPEARSPGRGSTSRPAPGATKGAASVPDALLDRWLATQHAPAAPKRRGLAAPARAAFDSAGLRVIATVEPAHPFGIVEAPAGACTIAVSKSGETLSLRPPGGQWRIAQAHGALAWCSATAETLTVWREGAAPVAVLSAPAVRLGGLLGARASARATPACRSPRKRPGWRARTSPWDADALLRASGLTDMRLVATRRGPGASGRSRRRAVHLATGASVISEPEGVVIACDPPLASSARETVCAHSAPVSWFNKKDALAGAARGSLALLDVAAPGSARARRGRPHPRAARARAAPRAGGLRAHHARRRHRGGRRRARHGPGGRGRDRGSRPRGQGALGSPLLGRHSVGPRRMRRGSCPWSRGRR